MSTIPRKNSYFVLDTFLKQTLRRYLVTMASPPRAPKRKVDQSAPISPPPLRRKLQSNTTQTAVASFFTPSSQKPLEKIIWQERAPSDDAPESLIVGIYAQAKDSVEGQKPTGGDVKRRKIAAFDFDSTLIQTSSGKKFATDAKDWKWWHTSVPATLRKLYLEDGFRVVVVSNQAGISLKPDTKGPRTTVSKLATFKNKVLAVFGQLNIPISIYAATGKDIYRKPRTGMWTELLNDYDIELDSLDLDSSIFVGDAAGREALNGQPKDFSCSDRNFAHNVGIRFYTPEEYFLGEATRPFTRTFDPNEYLRLSAGEVLEPYTKKNPCDIVLFCGSPAAGKSTFYWKNLEPLGYKRVNQDILKSREKCLKVAGEYLKDGKAVAIDNTNADPDVRKKWIELAAKHSVPIRCVLFTAGSEICEHNDAVRALNSTVCICHPYFPTNGIVEAELLCWPILKLEFST
ncbi:hypothetical protein ONS95_003878 [Cadophora gregata]|uniref:uncharacterized protein n=1 Tax=Cadophora gregata TaxID=51156 RepID=UPI0026DC29D0|nr:uncharacterized protein ONS95_003878 [Cadophora gregata]KAK0107173.1 hypothetical protein ONS95_003878 [Cadophora gregata]